MLMKHTCNQADSNVPFAFQIPNKNRTCSWETSVWGWDFWEVSRIWFWESWHRVGWWRDNDVSGDLLLGSFTNMNITVARTMRSQRGFKGSDRKLERVALHFVLPAGND